MGKHTCADCGLQFLTERFLAVGRRGGELVQICRDRGSCLERRQDASATVARAMRSVGAAELPFLSNEAGR